MNVATRSCRRFKNRRHDRVTNLVSNRCASHVRAAARSHHRPLGHHRARAPRRPDFTPQPVGAMGGDLCPFCEGQEPLAGRELLAWRPPGSAPRRPRLAGARRRQSRAGAARREHARRGRPIRCSSRLAASARTKSIIESPRPSRDVCDDDRRGGAARAVGVARADARSAPRHAAQELSSS